MDFNLADGVTWYSVFLFSTVCHEAAHAWTALKLGDDTAHQGGQVSLNPWPHIQREPIGMVVIPLISFFMSGWIMGWASAPYDPEWARRYPRRAGLMALAGPAANLLLMLAAAAAIRAGCAFGLFDVPSFLNMTHVTAAATPGPMDAVAQFVSVFFSLNLLLFVFNLLPIPPLDGSSVPLLLLPENAARTFFDLVRAPIVRLIGYFIVFRGLGQIFPPIFRFVASLLYPGVHYVA